MITLDQLISAWKATPTLHQFQPPATESEIEKAESALNARLPPVFRELYRFSNGLALSGGQLTVHPLIENDATGSAGAGSLLSMSDQLREWGWPVPKEVLIFGANGSGEPYGLWTGPHDEVRFPEPIVQIGEIFEPGCMGLSSHSLASLLLEDTVYGLIFEREYKVLSIHLGLSPEELPDPDLLLKLHEPAVDEDEQRRKLESVERTKSLEQWIHPDTNAEYCDPYKVRLDTNAMRALLS